MSIKGGSVPNTNQDIRITKTHMALSTTLMELLEKKSFQKITVNDICQRAMVSRSTFYLHFEDKYQLMLFCLHTHRHKLDEAAQNMEPRDFLHMAMNFVYERQKAFRIFLQAEIDIELVNMFNSFFHDYFSEVLIKYGQKGVRLSGPVPLLAAFYANGLAGMTVWWIEHDFSISTEEVAACQYNLLSDLLSNKE